MILASPSRRLGVARLWYEGNAFCVIPARRADFERREWAKGADALERSRGVETELAAVVDFLDRRPDWEAIVSRCASASPAGAIDHTLFEAFLGEVVADFSAARLDAIYLSLHGAAITDRSDEPERQLLTVLRERFPDMPIVASFDMHANHSEALIRMLSFSTGYRTYPHIDMRETAVRALDALEAIVVGRIRPVPGFAQGDLILSSANMRTEAGPMADVQKTAVQRIGSPILDISVFGGFPYADTLNIAASVIAWADGSADAASNTAKAVHALLEAKATDFDVTLPGPAEGLAQALGTPGLVAVTEPSDNPLSGGIGDTPGLFGALVAMGPQVESVFASFADPDLVARAWEVGLGGQLSCRIGGRTSLLYGAPVLFEGIVEALTDGRFINSGPMEHGRAVECGRTAMLRAGSIRVILTEHVAPANDPAFLTLHGVNLTATRLLCAKAKNHFRAAFKDICTAIIDIETPGPASLDLASLPLKRTRR